VLGQRCRAGISPRQRRDKNSCANDEGDEAVSEGITFEIMIEDCEECRKNRSKSVPVKDA
jgi:hypothetical protein